MGGLNKKSLRKRRQRSWRILITGVGINTVMRSTQMYKSDAIRDVLTRCKAAGCRQRLTAKVIGSRK